MPELIEVEIYRSALDWAIGRTIVELVTVDEFVLRGDIDRSILESVLVGSRLERTDRRGKLALGHLDSGHVLGLRFGMTGRLIVDGHAPIEQLEYGAKRDDPKWDRLVLRLDDGALVRLNDPRRLGSVEADPSLDRLGPDATTISLEQLTAAVRGQRALKAVLLDQSRVAGLGNLLVDEILWRAGLAPSRLAAQLDEDDVAHLRRVMRSTIRQLTRRGGSHRGDLQTERHRSGHCPMDGRDLTRSTIGGRTTYWCGFHQR